MEKGLLHKKVFLLKSPLLKKEVDSFIQEVRERMNKYKVTHYIPLKKMVGEDKMELVIIPCSETSGGKDPAVQQLIAEGFEASEQMSLSDISAASIRTFEFSKNVSFGAPKEKATKPENVPKEIVAKPESEPQEKVKISLKDFLLSLDKSNQKKALDALKVIKDSKNEDEKKQARTYLSSIGYQS